MTPATVEARTCPWCGEEIKAAAIICRFCHGDVTPEGEAEARRFAEARTGAPPRPAAMPGVDPVLSRLAKVFPASLYQSILESAESIAEGERRPITILFADISGFTSLTASLGAEPMSEFLAEIYPKIEETIAKYDGLVDKFIGDAVMALFGAHRAHGDDPERAIRAAIEIQRMIRGYRASRGYDLDTHSGIAFGEVVFEVHAGGGRIDYRTVGDAVNLASRLQSVAGRGETLTDHRIYQQTRTTFDWEDLKPIEIKGISQRVKVHRVTGIRKLFSKVVLGERVELVPLVGRAADLERLREAALGLKEDLGQTAIVRGPAGVGKSRLVYELYHRLPIDQFHWFTARCVSFGSSMPFLPFVKLLRSVFQVYDENEGALSSKEIRDGLDSAFAPLLRRAKKPETRDQIEQQRDNAAAAASLLLSVDEPANPLLALPPLERRNRLFNALTDLFAAISRDKPLVLVFEDFHWADPDSLELIDYLLTHLKGGRVLMLIVTRPEIEHRFPGQDDFITISLIELTAKESEQLLSRLLHLEHLPKSLKQRIIEKTEGNPFYLEEIILDLKERGLLDRRANRYVLKRDIKSIDIPDTVEGIVLARLDRLERSVKRVIQCASVIGQEFRYLMLERLTEARDRLRDYLVALVSGDYILQRTLLPELVYLFRHAVLREVTYQTLLERRRQEFHARLGQVMEELFKDNVAEFSEVIAFHFERGGVHERAAIYLEQSAEKCERLYSNHAAVDYWERLLKTLDAGKMKGRRALEWRLNAHLHLAELQRLLGNVRPSLQAARSALALAQEAKNASAETEALRRLAEALRLSGDGPAAAETARQARGAAHRTRDARLVAACENTLGHIERMQGNLKRARRCFETVLRIATDHGDRHHQFQALNHLGIVSMLQGDPVAANRFYGDALLLARELGFRDEQVNIEINLGINSLRTGDTKAAMRALTGAVSHADEIESERSAQLALLALSDVYLKTGDFTRALAELRRLRRRMDASCYLDVQTIALANEMRALLALGKVGSCEARLRQLDGLIGSDGNSVAALEGAAIHAELLLASGYADEARAQAQRFWRQARECGETEYVTNALLLLARSDLALGEPERARNDARRAVEIAQRSRQIRDEAWAAWILSRASREIGETEDSEVERKRALSLAQQVGDKALIEELRRPFRRPRYS